MYKDIEYLPNVEIVDMIRVFACRMACRCFWDSDTDNCAQDIFMNVCTNSFFYTMNEYAIIDSCTGAIDSFFFVNCGYPILSLEPACLF